MPLERREGEGFYTTCWHLFECDEAMMDELVGYYEERIHAKKFPENFGPWIFPRAVTSLKFPEKQSDPAPAGA